MCVCVCVCVCVQDVWDSGVEVDDLTVDTMPSMTTIISDLFYS